MKSILLAIALFGLCSTAQAANNCRDMWGNRAIVKMLDSKHLQIAFENRRYPFSGTMGYNGSNSTSHYFTNGSKLAQVEKTVFTRGSGNIWYHFKTHSEHNSKKTVKFICR